MGGTKSDNLLLCLQNKIVCLFSKFDSLPLRLFFLSLLFFGSTTASFAQTQTSQIDVLVLVDDKIFDSESSRDSFVQKQFGQLNDIILSNTDLNDVIFNVAAIKDIPHQNITVSQALAKLKSSAAPWNNVQRFRNATTPLPDIIVSFIREKPSKNGNCGIADEPVPDANTTRDKNIAVIGYTCTVAGSVQYTLAHELGHLLGATHDSGFSKNGAYKTIMSYGCTGTACDRIPYFSTPSKLYDGGEIGSVSQDNTSRIRGGAREVAFYAGGGEPSGLTCSEARYVPTRPKDPAAETVYVGTREFRINREENPEHWGFFVAPKTAAYKASFTYTGSNSSYKTELFRNCDDAHRSRPRRKGTGKTQHFNDVQLLKGERVYFKTTQLYGRQSYNLSTSFKAAETVTHEQCKDATELIPPLIVSDDDDDEDDEDDDDEIVASDDKIIVIYDDIESAGTELIITGDIRSTTSPVWHYFTAPADADYVVRVRPHTANQYMLASSLYWGGCDLQDSDDEIASSERKRGRDALRHESDQFGVTLGRVPLKRGEKLYIRNKLSVYYDRKNAYQAYEVNVNRVVSELDEAVLAARFLMVWSVTPGSNADNAGIMRGDAIVRYNGQVIKSHQDLLKARDNAVSLGLKTVTLDVLNISSTSIYRERRGLKLRAIPLSIKVGPLGITIESDNGSSFGSNGSGTYPATLVPRKK